VENLPVAAQSVDAVVCVSALHHLIDREQAFAEMSRVVGDGPLVVFTRDPRVAEPCWLEEYFPEVWAESYAAYPATERVSAELRRATGRMAKVDLFELPGSLSDYFAAAGWSRPELYLDEQVRAGMSPFVRTAPEFVKAGVERLRADLSSGLWDKRYGSRQTVHVGPGITPSAGPASNRSSCGGDHYCFQQRDHVRMAGGDVLVRDMEVRIWLPGSAGMGKASPNELIDGAALTRIWPTLGYGCLILSELGVGFVRIAWPFTLLNAGCPRAKHSPS
jgi:hypothetical protein